MATNTTKLGLIKPALADVVDVGNLNDNADSIDAAVGFTLCTNATRPASPWAGQVIFETDTGSSFVWDGDSWEAAGGGGGGVTVAATAPSPASDGDLWWNSNEGELYLYYNDGTSSQWVAAAGPSVTVQSTAPTGYEGQLWLDDTDGSMYVYYTDPGGANSQWIGAVSRSGGILQVVSTTKTDLFTSSSTSYVDVTGLSVSITPTSTSSKIYVMVQTNVGGDSSSFQSIQLVRDSTPINIGDAADSRTRASYMAFNGGTSQGESYLGAANVHLSILDSPSTTSTTIYKVQAQTNTSNFKINASGADSNAATYGRMASTITAIEVAG
jgi:hypothetical protein